MRGNSKDNITSVTPTTFKVEVTIEQERVANAARNDPNVGTYTDDMVSKVARYVGSKRKLHSKRPHIFDWTFKRLSDDIHRFVTRLDLLFVASVGCSLRRSVNGLR